MGKNFGSNLSIFILFAAIVGACLLIVIFYLDIPWEDGGINVTFSDTEEEISKEKDTSGDIKEDDVVEDASNDVKTSEEEVVKEEVEEVKEEDDVSVSEPLEVNRSYSGPESELTALGIIHFSNEERRKEELTDLSFNAKLTSAAEKKINDMFEKQYFAHNDPEGGMGASELAEMVGYEYILIGENLAMGDFKDDQNVVEAWMESPGHRMNIMKKGYTEIGVATKKGVYQDKEVWMAVQIFGTPVSECPSPDEELKGEVEENEEMLKDLQTEMQSILDILENEEYSGPDEYNDLIDTYDLLVEDHNELVEDTSELVEEYNRQAKEFRECQQKF
ncbi:MAG: CAP domain-containing protein [Candidatus Paceibacterota bacterium]